MWKCGLSPTRAAVFIPCGEAKLSFTAGGGFNAQNPFGQRSRCCHDICDNAVPCWTCMQSRAGSGRVAAELTDRLARISVRIMEFSITDIHGMYDTA